MADGTTPYLGAKTYDVKHNTADIVADLLDDVAGIKPDSALNLIDAAIEQMDEDYLHNHGTVENPVAKVEDLAAQNNIAAGKSLTLNGDTITQWPYANGGQLARAYFPDNSSSTKYWQKIADIQMSANSGHNYIISFEYGITAYNAASAKLGTAAQSFGKLNIRTGNSGAFSSGAISINAGYDFTKVDGIDLVAVVEQNTPAVISLWGSSNSNSSTLTFRVINETGLQVTWGEAWTTTYHKQRVADAVTALPGGTVIQPVYTGASVSHTPITAPLQVGRNVNYADEWFEIFRITPSTNKSLGHVDYCYEIMLSPTYTVGAGGGCMMRFKVNLRVNEGGLIGQTTSSWSRMLSGKISNPPEIRFIATGTTAGSTASLYLRTPQAYVTYRTDLLASYGRLSGHDDVVKDAFSWRITATPIDEPDGILIKEVEDISFKNQGTAALPKIVADEYAAVSENIKLIPGANGSGGVIINVGETAAAIRPRSSGSLDNGTSNYKWKNGYYTGAVTAGDPSADSHLTTKKYVDKAVGSAGKGDMLKSDYVGANATGIVRASQVHVHQSLAEGTDYNSLRTAGHNYSAPSNAVAGTMLNAPTKYSHGLEIRHSGSSITQRVTEYNPSNPKQYVRNYYSYSTTWGPWYRIYSEANKPTAAEVGALAAGGTAVNAAQLNGQAASYYATTAALNSKANTDVLTKTNTTPYTPSEYYHPATKAFVEAHVEGIWNHMNTQLMPLAGSQFTGAAYAYWAENANIALRNSVVQNSAGANVPSTWIAFRRI